MRKSFSLAFFFFSLYFPGTKHSLSECTRTSYCIREELPGTSHYTRTSFSFKKSLKSQITELEELLPFPESLLYPNRTINMPATRYWVLRNTLEALWIKRVTISMQQRFMRPRCLNSQLHLCYFPVYITDQACLSQKKFYHIPIMQNMVPRNKPKKLE